MKPRLSLLIIVLFFLTLDLKLIRHRRLFAALIILVNGVEDTRCSSSASGAEATRRDGREARHAGAEVAVGTVGAVAAELLAGSRSRSGGLLASLELEKGFFFAGSGVFEEDDATGGLGEMSV